MSARKPKLNHTYDLSVFVTHEYNRPLRKIDDDDILYRSMKRSGFMPSGAIHCTELGDGKLKVVRGHHRLQCAKLLKLPVWYIVDDSNTNLFELEGDGRQKWSLLDFVHARAAAGDKQMKNLIEFSSKYGFPIGVCADIYGGQTATSGNKARQIKAGTFTVSDNQHAKDVTSVTEACREVGLTFATTRSFVKAVSMVVRIPELNRVSLVESIKKHCRIMKPQRSTDDYLQLLENTYNHQRHTKMSVVWRAKEICKNRQVAFGECKHSYQDKH